MNITKNMLIGFATIICSIAFLLLVAAPAQIRLGLLGLGITEIGLLVIALLGCLLLKSGLKDTFPLKRPRFTEFRGSAYIYISVYFFTIGVSILLLFVFPGMQEVSNALIEFFSEGGVLLFVVVSLLPGICEEALFRGTIQSAFRSMKSTAAIVIIVGGLFGLFHLDIYRFLPTMILGMGFSYIMIKTGNLLYSIFLHALHNFFGIIPILWGNASDAATSLGDAADVMAESGMNTLTLTGIVIAFFSIGLLFLRLGVRRLNDKNAGGEGKIKRIVFNIVCIIILLLGLALAGLGAMQTV